MRGLDVWSPRRQLHPQTVLVHGTVRVADALTNVPERHHQKSYTEQDRVRGQIALECGRVDHFIFPRAKKMADDEKQHVIDNTDPPKGLFNVNWEKRAANVISYLNINPRPKRKPRLVRMFGYKNFRLGPDKKTLFVYGREVLLDAGKIKKILEAEETGYGGVAKTYARISRKYLGITARDVGKFFAESERRQLKMPKQGRGANRAFIHASRPGMIEADCTFYHGAKYVVFGMVDVFSRWCHYELIDHKQPIDTGRALLNGLEKFKKFNHTLMEVRTDSGGEFLHDKRNTKGKKQPDFRSILLDIKKKNKHFRIVHRKQPMRIIEGLNGILRRYVQRVDYETKDDLRKLVARFVREYNSSPSRTLGGKTPNAIIAIHGKDQLRKEAERQFAAKQAKVSTSKYRLKELKVGSLVRISLLVDKEKIGHHGEKPNWSKQLYTVTKIIKSSRGPERFKVKDVATGKAAGPFFRDRLLAVVKPTHSIGQKSKYQPGARKKGDIAREKAAMRPDVSPKIKWAHERSYADAQDVREDSGDEFVADVIAPKKRKRKQRRIIPKKKAKMIGRKVYVMWEGEEYTDETAVILERYKEGWIVWFRKDKSVGWFDDDDIARLTPDFMSEAFVKKTLKEQSSKIAEMKDEE